MAETAKKNNHYKQHRAEPEQTRPKTNFVKPHASRTPALTTPIKSMIEKIIKPIVIILSFLPIYTYIPTSRSGGMMTAATI